MEIEKTGEKRLNDKSSDPESVCEQPLMVHWEILHQKIKGPNLRK